MADDRNLNQRKLIPAINGYLNAGFSRIKTPVIIIFRVLQQPAPQFPYKPFSLATALILAFLQVITTQAESPIFDSNRPALYYAGVTSFLACNLAYGFEITASSHPVYPLPAAASNVLRRCMFLTGSLSFAATAAFLFPESVRAVIVALTFSTMSGCALLFWVHHRVVGKCFDLGLGRCVLFIEDKWRRVSCRSHENQCATVPAACRSA